MIVIDMDMPTDCSKCLCNQGCANYYYMKNERPRLCPIKCDIEDIKAEILFITEKCLPNCTAEEYEVKGLKEALNIINKYTKG